jgi:hypothetical protein
MSVFKDKVNSKMPIKKKNYENAPNIVKETLWEKGLAIVNVLFLFQLSQIHQTNYWFPTNISEYKTSKCVN